MFGKGALELVDNMWLGYYMVQKVTHGLETDYRLVFSELFDSNHLKLETVSSVLELIGNGDMMFLIDF